MDGSPGGRRLRDAERLLVVAGYAFVVGSAVHLFDHLRRGQGSVTEHLYWLGNVGLVIQAVLITLILTRHRIAPVAAVVAGVPLALGFAAAHWLPTWSSFSDSFVSHNVSPFSYFASAFEIAGAVAVAIAGANVLLLKREGTSEPLESVR